MNHSEVAVFAPGEYLHDELEARGWSQLDLADITRLPAPTISQIITGKKAVTASIAILLGQALGTSAELWLNLESVYRLRRMPAPDPAVEERARLVEKRRGRAPFRRGRKASERRSKT